MSLNKQIWFWSRCKNLLLSHPWSDLVQMAFEKCLPSCCTHTKRELFGRTSPLANLKAPKEKKKKSQKCWSFCQTEGVEMKMRHSASFSKATSVGSLCGTVCTEAGLRLCKEPLCSLANNRSLHYSEKQMPKKLPQRKYFTFKVQFSGLFWMDRIALKVPLPLSSDDRGRWLNAGWKHPTPPHPVDCGSRCSF